jgi:retron-type reverse transcriptase
MLENTCEYVSWEDIEAAYLDFLKKKRSTESAYSYMQIASRDLPKLLNELNDKTYEIGTSVTFCATKPKLREVFAAAPRDRVVHHLLIMKFADMFEYYSIDNSFNCRKGLGNSAMTKYVHNSIAAHKNGWILKLDIKGCFMSMSKNIMWSMLKDAIIDWSTTHKEIDDKLDYWLWLWHKIIYHRPELDCEIHGDPNLFDKLSDDKTLRKSNGKGIAIGNLTSQILANFYFSRLDHALEEFTKSHGATYGRYMDDMVLVCDDELVLIEASNLIKSELDFLKLKLHPRKFYMQKARKSVKVVGIVHKDLREYVSSLTVNNAFAAVDRINRDIEENVNYKDDLDYMIAVINSYLGFMKGMKTYAIRRRIFAALNPKLFEMTYNKRYLSLRIKPEYNKRRLLRIELAERALNKLNNRNNYGRNC